MTNQSEVTLLLLGDAGVGKSTFLSYVLASGCSQTPSSVCISSTSLAGTGISNVVFLSIYRLTEFRRISKPSSDSSSTTPDALLRDGDQPFIFNIRNKKGSYQLDFYDTSSPENWTLLTPNVIILCYDISSRLSLINIQRLWIQETQKVFGDRTDLPVLLLGLKRDLRSETDPNGIIYPQEAYRIAQELRCDKYMECSGMTGELVHEAFEDICKTAVLTTTAEGGLSKGGCCSM